MNEAHEWFYYVTTDCGRSGPFETRAAAERFLNGVAAAGKCTIGGIAEEMISRETGKTLASSNPNCPIVTSQDFRQAKAST